MFRHFAEPKRGHSVPLSEVVLQMLFSVRIFVFWRNSELEAPWHRALSLSLSSLCVPTLLRKSSAFQGTQTFVNRAGKPSFSYLLPSARSFAQNMKSITRNCSAIILIWRGNRCFGSATMVLAIASSGWRRRCACSRINSLPLLYCM